MKAIQLKEFNATGTVSDVDKPKPKPRQLLQIKAGGFCHTDCMARENAFGSKLPFIGPLMEGITTDGAWAEYMAADARFTVELPDSLDFPTAACMMCAGITVYVGIKRAQVLSGGSIGIVGVGGLGHVGTEAAKQWDTKSLRSMSSKML
ncbi:alcohol dehydrogenase [Fusarium agapanthi]|uniref:Alcohol dehydrogenase n=1 Tax=Fusarium agapanthi TaxID=1803897 RepID=A0A9P5B415_9HYPO|nr:alcohol dehydrogenase [Fusarium agapanthi]